jgi:O-antigen/teichoic acid export membrane protein
VFSISKLLAYLAVTRYFEFTLQAAILSDSIAYAASYVVLAIAHLQHCRANNVERTHMPDDQERRRLFRFSVASHFNESSSLLLYSQTDNFFVAAMMNPLAVGAYSFFTRINEMVTQLVPTRLFENVVQPVIYATPQEQAPERLPRYFTFLINISMVAQWPIIMMSVVYHREIIELAFGGKFIEYSQLMPIVLAFAWSDNVPSLPVTMLALHAEKASLILKSQLFGVYQVVAMLALIPVMGLYGAAIATGTLHLFRNLWVWWKMRHTARWLNFGAAVRFGFAIWGAAALVCFRSGAISQSDREIMANLMHGRESRLLHRLGLAPRIPALGTSSTT